MNQNEIIVSTENSVSQKISKKSVTMMTAEAAFLAYAVYKLCKYIDILGDKKARKKS